MQWNKGKQDMPQKAEIITRTRPCKNQFEQLNAAIYYAE